MINETVELLKDDLIAATIKLVKIKSVQDEPKEGAPYGTGVAASLSCALNIAEGLGFKTVNLDGYVGYAEYGQGEEYVGVLGHLDVVPEGEGWTYPAYGAEIHDGKIYARGTLDDKGPILAALYGLKAICDEHLPLSKRVRIIFGTNEETGSQEIEYYLKKEKPPVSGFTPDAEFPVIHGEKGITVFNLVKDLSIKPAKGDVKLKSLDGGEYANVVPDNCDCVLECSKPQEILKTVEAFKIKTGKAVSAEAKGSIVRIHTSGVSAHGSVPQLGVNAVSVMMELLGHLNFGDCDISDFINFYNKYIGYDPYGEVFGVAMEDEVSGKLSFNMGVAHIKEDSAALGMNLRYPVSYKLEDMMVPFNKTIENTGIKVEDFRGESPLYYAVDHPLVSTLMRVYKEQTGNTDKPMAIGGGTYAKAMPNTVAFGPVLPGHSDIIHQPDEFITIDDLVTCAKIYGHAIYELAK